MSLVLKPEIPLAQAFALNMAAAVAVARAISGLYSLKTGIKWPNDLLIGERKVCGILMEVSAEVDRLEYAVIGIGINANVDVTRFPEEWRSTSLCRELCREVSRVELIHRILLEIEGALVKPGSREIYEEWRLLSTTLGRRVRIASSYGDLEGVASDLAGDGALCLETAEGRTRILAGDCIHLRALGDA
jgi:BirA family biotin operon repressor/biotin-[acetyl-CoA-carboxylase] ligase